MKSLDIIAGKNALRLLDEGCDPKSRIATIAGAAGGPKWTSLAAMDKIIHQHMVPHFNGVVPLYGSSIGSWRMACYARQNPIDVIDRFLEAYLGFDIGDGGWSKDSLKTDMLATINLILSDEDQQDPDIGINEILSNPVFRLNIITARATRLTETSHSLPLAAASLASAVANGFARSNLQHFWERVVFHDPRQTHPLPGWDKQAFASHRAPLDRSNMALSLLASASIPLISHGIENLNHAPPGIYWDGGMLDYHMDLPYDVAKDQFVLLPHFSRHVHSGWFDKYLPHRKGRPDPQNMANVLLVAPSQAFIDSLPYGKIPDRNDFKNLNDAERRHYWKQVTDRMPEVADMLEERIARNDWSSFAEPFPN